MQNPENLQIYKFANELVTEVYRVEYPSEEKFGLQSQIRRASTGIVLAVAEGCGVSSEADFIRYLGIARASAQEVKACLLISKNLNYINAQLYSELNDKFDKLGRQLTNFIKARKELVAQ